MRILPPVTIENNNYISSNVTEPDSNDLGASLWVSGNGYTANTSYVYRDTTHMIYKCINNITAGSAASQVLPEISVLSVPPYWAEVQPTNKWALFNYKDSTTTKRASPLVIEIGDLSQRVDSLALVGMVGVTHVLVEVTQDSWVTTDVIYDQGFELPSLVLYTLPPYYHVKIRVTLTGASNVECKALAVGYYEDAGFVQNGVVSDSVSFSIVERDMYGNSYFQKRRAIPKLSLSTLAEARIVNRLGIVRDKLNAVPAVWCGLNDDSTSPFFDTLLLLGIYKNFSISLDNHLASIVQLELEEI